MAFVMILHLPVDRNSMLLDILSRWTLMPVVEAFNGGRLVPNHVYIPPPHAMVAIVAGCFGIQLPSETGDRLFRPIDGFFDSLGADMGDMAVGVVLSGTGSDGALGLKAIKECGGLTLAQGSLNGSAPQYGEMPAGAIATGAVDIISPIEEMPGHLMRLKGMRIEIPSLGDPASDVDAARLDIGGPMADSDPDPWNRSDKFDGRRQRDRFADEPPVRRFKHLLAQQPLSDELTEQLRSALEDTCEQFQSLAEQHQTALEELRSANEELHSVNEELQSTNEELQTSREELQSTNEELHTVNARLTEKVDELDKANSDVRNLFESTEIATVFLDRHLVIRSFTPAIAALYNLIPSDQGRPLTDIQGRLVYTGLREDVAFVLATLEPLERRVVRDDHAAHYIMRILPYREPDSTVTGVLVTFLDVTNIVQAEEALVAADVRKDVFLATLSHELRNPLAPIRIAAQLLQSPKLGQDELMRTQAIIARQVSHMSSLLDDLLDVSRITRGTFLLKKEYVDVQQLMEDAIEVVQPAMNAKSHTLRVERPAAPVRLEVDPLRLTQVITNLLTNAAKYTPAGGLIHMGTRDEAQHLVIFVRDNGVGLSADSMSSVFDMFTRIDSEIGRSEGGLGIGLALAKGLMELHGGHLRVYSAGRGQGSEFMVFIPRSLIVKEPTTIVSTPPNDAPNQIAPRSILIADDNRDSAETMSMLLRLSGHVVHVAHSGVEALEVAKRVRPSIGIFDIGMPDLSGYEVAARIRHEAWGENMTLIAVTGWGQESDKRQALAAGFDHHLTKPVDPDKLELSFDR